MPNNLIVALALARVVFIPTTILTATQNTTGGFFDSDAVKFVNLILFSISNGYLSTQCSIKAPQFVGDEQKM